MTQPSQPYDSSLKSLFENYAAEIVPELLPGARVIKELNGEVLKPPLRTDRLLEVEYNAASCILHSEFETSGDGDIVYRLLEYYGILYRKYRRPVISMVIYPFQTKIPESPLRIRVGEEEFITFNFRVVALWNLDARDYLARHVVSMYNLLPTMQGANYELLRQGLDEMKDHYGKDRREFAEHLLRFDTFLQRANIVSADDKRRTEAILEEFGSLVEESRFVKKAKAEALEVGKAEGREVGKAEGREVGMVEALQKAVVEIVEERFPPLAQLAERQVAQVNEPQMLHQLVKKVSTAPDEAAMRSVLTALAA